MDGVGDVGLTVDVLAPGDDLAVLQQGGIVVQAAVELHGLGAHFGDLILAVHDIAPDGDLAVFVHGGAGVAGGGNVHDVAELRHGGDGVGLEAAVGDGAVVQQGDIVIGGQGDLFHMPLDVLFDLDIAHVLVAPGVDLAVLGDGHGELIPRLQLHEAQVAVGDHGSLELRGQDVLTQPVVAPDINLTFVVQGGDVVVAGGNLHDVGFLNLLGNLRQVDLIGDLGIAPGVDLARVGDADGVGGAGGDIDELSLHIVRGRHHAHGGRHVGLGVVLIGKIQGVEPRPDHHDEKNHQKDAQTGHAQGIVQEVLQSQTAGTLHLLLFQEAGLGAFAKQTGEKAALLRLAVVLCHFHPLLTCPREPADRPDRSSDP